MRVNHDAQWNREKSDSTARGDAVWFASLSAVPSVCRDRRSPETVDLSFSSAVKALPERAGSAADGSHWSVSFTLAVFLLPAADLRD